MAINSTCRHHREPTDLRFEPGGRIETVAVYGIVTLLSVGLTNLRHVVIAVNEMANPHGLLIHMPQGIYAVSFRYF